MGGKYSYSEYTDKPERNCNFPDPGRNFYNIGKLILLLLLLFIVYLITLFQYLRPYSVDVGGKPAASAQFLLSPDSSARARAI
jgi:hypothetical protein